MHSQIIVSREDVIAYRYHPEAVSLYCTGELLAGHSSNVAATISCQLIVQIYAYDTQ